METTRDLALGEPVLFLALSLIIVGVGFLKANISTVVGALYEENDPRRDGGFTIFYVGINLGSFLATIACSYLGIKYGWAYGFGLAGIGMLFGLLTFVLGQSWLEGRGAPPVPVQGRSILGVPLVPFFWIAGIVAVIPTWLLMQRHEIIETALPWIAGVIFAAVVGFTVFRLKGAERSRMLVAQVLIFFSVLFWALFEQAGSSLTLFADQSTQMPSWFNAAMTQTFNPGIIVLGGPIIAALWVWLAKRKLEPSTPVKFSFGLVFVGLGFLVLTWAAATQANDAFRVPLIFLFLTYFLQGSLKFTPIQTGLGFLPMVVMLVIAAQLSTNLLLPRLGAKVMVPFGMVLGVIGMLLLTRLSLDSTYAADVLPALLVLGFAMGSIMPASMQTATLGVDRHFAGVASAMVNTSQQVGGSIGTALLNTIAATAVTNYIAAQTVRTPTLGESAAIAGYQAAYVSGAIFFAVGAVLSVLLFRRKGRGTSVATVADPDALPVAAH
ncbi:MAG TPA: hypothetical protein DCP95_00180 [Microbacterium ginsengisoli]|uniref:Major facilitator superfamily (MFS) profile domain-containing protein n=1 Tax=Microbacterium ginsengisoli TaxID=400772 RepID=A0A3C1K9Q8_9MICO|nr:hypothetical protein [Microbacterium ginsengisoli]